MSQVLRTLWILCLGCLSSAEAAPSPKALQKTLSVLSKKGMDIPDHMHVVCHSLGCAEVKAKLQMIQEKQTIAKQKLDECSRTRKQLAADLAAAAKSRGKAEAALAQCATERAKLAAELRQCAQVDRPNAEKALAKCAAERSQLEAELRQCAEVDRPNAEKALAQCATDRAKLEKKLALVVKALKEKAAGGGAAKKKKSSRRRRRRSSKRSALIQLHTGLSDMSNSAYASMSAARLRMERHMIWGFIEKLKTKAKVLMGKVQLVDKRIAGNTAKLDAMDGKQAKLMKDLTQEQAKEETKQKELDKVEKRSDSLVGELTQEDSKLEAAQKKLTDAMSAEEKAGADLAKEQAAETSSLLELASLVQEEHRALHEDLELKHRNATKRLRSNEIAMEALLSKDNEEECDAVRADVIKAQGKLHITGQALQACLKAKKEIKDKIDQAVELGKKAEAGLSNCLKTKAELKTKIKMCHERRDMAREKLKACLERKKVLKVQIEKCHEKRDEARKKLKECLTRKAELKAKIANAQGGPQKRSSLVQEITGLEAEAAELLHALQQGNMELLSAMDDLGSASSEEQAHVAEMQDQSAAGDKALSQCVAQDAAQSEAESGAAGTVELLKGAIGDLSSAGNDLDGAANANAATEKEVGLLEMKVAALL